MRIEDIRACEGIMRDIPKMSASLVAMERSSHGNLLNDIGKVQGGEHIPAAVRLSEDRIRNGTIETIQKASDIINELPHELREIIVDVYFLGMRHEDAALKLGLNRRTLTRKCRSAIEHIAPTILPLYGRVLAWRNKWENDIVRTWTRQA